MKLLTAALAAKFKEVGVQDNGDPLILAKFFCPWNRWTWYATEYDFEVRRFFGLVDGDEVELGYFDLDEMEAVRGLGGLTIERDIYWEPKRLSEVKSDVMAVRSV